MFNYYLDLDELAQSAVTALQACPLHFAQFLGLEGAQNKQIRCKIGQETNNAVKQMAQKLSI